MQKSLGMLYESNREKLKKNPTKNQSNYNYRCDFSFNAGFYTLLEIEHIYNKCCIYMDVTFSFNGAYGHN